MSTSWKEDCIIRKEVRSGQREMREPRPQKSKQSGQDWLVVESTRFGAKVFFTPDREKSRVFDRLRIKSTHATEDQARRACESFMSHTGPYGYGRYSDRWFVHKDIFIKIKQAETDLHLAITKGEPDHE